MAWSLEYHEGYLPGQQIFGAAGYHASDCMFVHSHPVGIRVVLTPSSGTLYRRFEGELYALYGLDVILTDFSLKHCEIQFQALACAYLPQGLMTVADTE